MPLLNWVIFCLENSNIVEKLFPMNKIQVCVCRRRITQSNVLLISTLHGLLIYSFLAAHYNDIKMRAVASQISSVSIVCSTVGSGAEKRKHQSSPVTGEFPAQKASNAENISIWWRHRVVLSGFDRFAPTQFDRSALMQRQDEKTSNCAITLSRNRLQHHSSDVHISNVQIQNA